MHCASRAQNAVAFRCDMAPSPQKILQLLGTVILVLGLIGAAAIYATAGDDGPDRAMGYEIVNGVVNPIASGDLKRYRHDLERYGGKMAVVTDEFGTWFSGLWHGKSLGVTVALLCVALSGAIFLLAHYMATDRTPDDDGNSNND
jgi:hypothetical protein